MTSKKLLWTVAAIAFPLGMAQAQAPSSAPSATADSSSEAPAATSDQAVSTTDVAPSGSTTGADSATTTADSSTTAAPAASGDTPVAVSKADVQKGATVLGSDGSAIGKIESVTADAAVVSTGKAKAQIPFTSFGKTDKGLVIAMSKSQFEAAASGKSAS